MPRRILLLAGMILLAAAPVGAETFDLYFFTYCPSTDPMCGYASQDEYHDYILAAVQNMNVEWERLNISFRPVVWNIQQNDYYGVTEGCDSDIPQELQDRRQEWRANVAAVFPNAISVMITPNASWCCSHIPQSVYGDPSKDAFPALFGIFCSMSWDAMSLGSILAHEVGHYFCLVHTQTFQDPATNPPTPDHDNDDCCSVNDTPPDPARLEGFVYNSSTGDLDMNGNMVNGHEWCANQSSAGLTDDFSPHTTVCQPGCFLFNNNMQTTTSFQPLKNMAMSYYMPSCHGPYVINGVISYAFSNDSVNQVRNVCIPQVPERAALPDVCDGHGGDTDHDGICQDVDNCPNDKNTNQQDTDSDGTPDGCDLCPGDPNPTGDLDGDGLGDLCDPDKDGDTCDDDTEDEDPDVGVVRTGYHFNSGCGFGIEPTYSSAEIDPDFDAYKSCADVDDDNDGICDGPVAHGPGAPGAPQPNGCQAGPDPCPEVAGFGCYVVQGSPTLCPPSWLDCLGGGCIEFFLKIVSVINPGDQLTFDGFFQINNRKIYTAPLAGKTLSQTGKALQGEEFTSFFRPSDPLGSTDAAQHASAALAGQSIRLEIWSYRTGQRVAIVGQFDPSNVALADLRRGAMLEITPTVDAAGVQRLDVAAVYGTPTPDDGQAPPEVTLDADGDRRPDIADNCVMAANFLQADADGDGFGNVCDADIDGDLVVGDADVALISGCLGADLAYESPVGEPGDDEGGAGPQPHLMELKIHCGAMDLDDDQRVTPQDVAIAEQARGAHPGPSSKADPDTGCTPADCDDGLACTHDYCDPFSNQCRHVAGSCDDGNTCTTDVCSMTSGQCQHSALACDDGNACTRDFCDQAAGGCTSLPEPDGLACNDADACTTGEICRSGQCGGGTPRNCSDGNPCTVDTCNPLTGQCQSAAGACDDGNPCTRDLCSPTTGACSHVNEANGEVCSDSNRCTAGDVCRDGLCSAQPVVCNDGNACTTDTCAPSTGLCTNAPVPCDDGDACTIDTCGGAAGGCVHTSVSFAQVLAFDMPGPFAIKWVGPPNVSWNLYRGSIPMSLMGSRRSAYDHVCLETGDFLADGPTSSIDPGLPPAGTAFYYVATDKNDCGEGPPGFSSANVPRPLPQPCVPGS